MRRLYNGIDRRALNPATLAFLGDGVYELLVREAVVGRFGSLPSKKLHALSVQMVCASAQAAAYAALAPQLSEEEHAVFRRGRNAAGLSVPRHASVADYRAATGLEVLFGWLYLGGETERMLQLFSMILDEVRQHETTDSSQQADAAIPQG